MCRPHTSIGLAIMYLVCVCVCAFGGVILLLQFKHLSHIYSFQFKLPGLNDYVFFFSTVFVCCWRICCYDFRFFCKCACLLLLHFDIVYYETKKKLKILCSPLQ